MKVPIGLLVLVGSAALLSGCGGDNQQTDDRQATRTALAAPTSTPTDTATETPTNTPSATPTVTNTSPPTNTPTITPTATDTPTGVRPTFTPLGERLFTIADTAGSAKNPDQTRTGLFSSAVNGVNVATKFSAGPIRLIGSSPGFDGVAQVTLAEDAEFTVDSLGGAICFRILAEGTTGFIDCDGGTGVDVTVTAAAGPDATPTVESGLGAGPAGGLLLMAMQQSAVLGLGTNSSQCATATYGAPELVIYTTGVAMATKGASTITITGEGFFCSQFNQTDTAGMLVQPSAAFNTLSPNPDVANGMRLADNAEVPPTPTPTMQGEETPTPTATAVASPIGERLFSIASPNGGLNTPPDMTRTGLFSTGLSGNNVATTFAAQDFTLVAGPPDANGVAPLSVKSDFVFAVGNPISLVCFRVRAAGSTGVIDCDGGTAVDVSLSQEGGTSTTPPPVLETGLGEDGGPGAASLMVTQESVQLAATATLNDCLTATYDAPTTTVYTTGIATVTKGAKVLSVPTGENFDCETFTTTDGPGMLINPSVANNPPVGDVANILRLADDGTLP